MKNVVLIICLLSCIKGNVFSQSVFSLDLKKDIPLSILSIGMTVTSFLINNEPVDIPYSLSRYDVNRFDRPLMFSHKRALDLISDNFPFAMVLLPVISLMPNIRHKNTVLTYSIMYSQALLLTYGTVFTLKASVNRFRPYVYTSGIPSGRERDFHNSFPSGAAAFAFLGATFLNVTFSKEFPGSRWRLPLTIGSYTLAASVAAGRVIAGAHFLSDVILGAFIGSAYGALIPLLHLNSNNKNIAVTPRGNGITVSLRF